MRNKFIKYSLLLLIMLFASHAVQAEEVWIDVRSVMEHKVDSIQGDVHIPHEQIVEKIKAVYPDKETEIRLYCRSGGRAGKALSALQKAGYKDVKNMGGIEDARIKRNLK